MPNSEVPTPTITALPIPGAVTSTTPDIDIGQLYAVIGAKEVLICRLNAVVGEFQNRVAQLEAQIGAVQRECESLRFGRREEPISRVPG